MTARQLRRAEERLRAAEGRYNAALENRNALVRCALDEGWTHAQIAEATDLTRSRVGQLALRR